jgi:hypothetical protein
MVLTGWREIDERMSQSQKVVAESNRLKKEIHQASSYKTKKSSVHPFRIKLFGSGKTVTVRAYTKKNR